MTTTTNGPGHRPIAHDLYAQEVRRVAADIRRRHHVGEYVCMATIIAKMPAYNRDILWNVLWTMALTEGL